jgi:hypothetical protein
VSWQKGIAPDPMARPKKYPDELVERGIRLALESKRPIAHIAHDLASIHRRVSGFRPVLSEE